MMLPTSSRSGKKTSKLVAPLDSTLCRRSAVSSTLASTITSPVVSIDHVGSGQRAIKLGGFHFNLLDAGGAKRLQRVRVILRPECAISSPLVQNGMRRLGAQQVRAAWSHPAAPPTCSLPSAMWMRSTV